MLEIHNAARFPAPGMQMGRHRRSDHPVVLDNQNFVHPVTACLFPEYARAASRKTACPPLTPARSARPDEQYSINARKRLSFACGRRTIKRRVPAPPADPFSDKEAAGARRSGIALPRRNRLCGRKRLLQKWAGRAILEKRGERK